MDRKGRIGASFISRLLRFFHQPGVRSHRIKTHIFLESYNLFTVPVSIWMKAAFKETNRWKNRKPTGWQPPI